MMRNGRLGEVNALLDVGRRISPRPCRSNSRPCSLSARKILRRWISDGVQDRSEFLLRMVHGSSKEYDHPTDVNMESTRASTLTRALGPQARSV